MMKTYFLMVIFTIFAVLCRLSGAAFANDLTAAQAPSIPVAATSWVGEEGTASYYGAAHQGRRTASGTQFDKMALTAAHPWLPFGSKVRVTLANTGRSIVVTITDRLYSTRRVVDLSLGAARQLGMVGRGIAEVTLSPG
jgi:rare lipoprotein A